ncbi:hypothetical protein GWI33_003518 [Rhynchophorus ferrugineus]|uniref:Uncharacterized protein n=1 Tax=Rhynchophorus ferrugineus TaxID=354439 RepID=A0A834M2Y9_RHYFE|nr:hypothetical protein GWI33_003518 [Rhynchophorus ferrugineus]
MGKVLHSQNFWMSSSTPPDPARSRRSQTVSDAANLKFSSSVVPPCRAIVRVSIARPVLPVSAIFSFSPFGFVRYPIV